MMIRNETQVTFFEFSGLTDNKQLEPFLFTLFLVVYVVTICGNTGMISVVHLWTELHTPMYYFLSYLSTVDLFYSSVVTPKMLCDLLSKKKTISFVGCALQFLFFTALAITEVLVLSIMSYDRYVAICHPLHYILKMTKKKCRSLVLIAFTNGLVLSTSLTTCLFTLQFCGSNYLDHFYCDIPPILKLSCSDTFACDVLLALLVCSCNIGSLTIILVSYVFIISAILRMKSTRGQKKAFSTCSSHLMCSTMFYVTVFFTYLHPSSGVSEKQDKVPALFYSVMTPMLNPIIYSLRNQEVRRVIMKRK
ncbi:olfactory receptor 5AR1-like [Gastrophryne carolinensis]